MMRLISLLALTVFLTAARADEFKHVGDFLLQAHFKLTGKQVTPIPMKPIAFRVYTDGIHFCTIPVGFSTTTREQSQSSSGFALGLA